MLRSANGLWNQCRSAWIVRAFSMRPGSGGFNNENGNANFSESADDFERRIFGDDSDKSLNPESFYKKFDNFAKFRERNNGGFRSNDDGSSSHLDGLDETYSILSDGVDDKLKKASRYFHWSEEMEEPDYSFRPDANIRRNAEYTPKDHDLTRPASYRNQNRPEFEVTTKEVLEKADFRNVRFLANFITEAGIIIKRSKTRISAKAQRRVAREIKTARAFGLMPFTTMGTKPFVFGRSMEDLDEDYEFEDRSPRRFVEIEEDKLEDPVDTVNPIDSVDD